MAHLKWPYPGLNCLIPLFLIICGSAFSMRITGQLNGVKPASKEKYSIINRTGSIWCKYTRNGKAIFDLRIGGGGAIAQLRWCGISNTELLSPTYAGEHTDRIIQSTWWINSLTNNQTSNAEKRWNVTQGGNGRGTFSPVNSVRVDQRRHLIDVYSDIKDQWNNSFDSTFHGGYKMLTRYQGLANGVIQIRRIMIAQQPDSDGIAKPYKSLYIEGWTPFNCSAHTFNALALGFDRTGKPDWWYGAGYNIPAYQNRPVDKTNGYAVVYHTTVSAPKVFAAFIFGNKQVNSSLTANYALNTFSWTDGIGILPGLNLANFPVGGIIDQSFYLYVSTGLNIKTVAFLNSLVDQIPAVKIYKPSDQLPADVAVIVNNINQNTVLPGTRTEHLAELTTGF